MFIFYKANLLPFDWCATLYLAGPPLLGHPYWATLTGLPFTFMGASLHGAILYQVTLQLYQAKAYHVWCHH